MQFPVELPGGYVLRHATRDDARALAADLREADRHELVASAGPGESVWQAIHFSYLNSLLVLAVEWRGTLLSLAGVSSHNPLAGDGVPWALCTASMDAVRKRAVVAVGRVVLRAMREVCPGRLVNHVDARNSKSQLWLRWMGFTIEPEPAPYGAAGLPFFRFSMEGRAHV